MSQQINARLVSHGVQVMERFAIEFGEGDAGKAARELFESDRSMFFSQLIEQNGNLINRLTILKSEAFSEIFGRDPQDLRPETFHIVYPPEERSGWICCCA